MKLSFVDILCLSLVVTVAQWSFHAHAGIAFCEIRASRDAVPEIRLKNIPFSDSSLLNSAIRKELKDEFGKKIPHCREPSRSKFEPGNWKYEVGLVRRKTSGGKWRYVFGIGFGKTASEAQKDLTKHLGTRDWSWVQAKHGYETVESGDFSIPERDSACYQLVKYRDTQLVKQVDKEFEIARRLQRDVKTFEDLEAEFDGMETIAAVAKQVERVVRLLDGTAAFVSSYVPVGADISHASGTLAGKLAIAYQTYGRSKNLVGAVRGEVIAFSKTAAAIVAKKSNPIGYALKANIGNIEAAKNIVEAAKSDREWSNAIDTLGQSVATARGQLKQLELLSLESQERLATINDAKVFIDELCDDNPESGVGELASR